ncbi:MAG TPA: S26 family signal peptidase [Candidatus Thermoplasmatota archaeon]|nr:S26 family signal peptidase [Candidatus Thermoplasmatota archaeon]
MGFASRRWRQLEAFREYVFAIALVSVVVGGIYAYSGTWPPMVVIESGSMMHPDKNVQYGRVGTIDPGDLVLVQRAPDPSHVALWTSQRDRTYGDFGDVIVYQVNGDPRSTPIIHRAIAWVEVTGELRDDGRDSRSYSVRWIDGEVFSFGSEGIYMPELKISEVAGFSRSNGYKPLHSGFITWGDNRVTNPAPDQVARISPQPVHPNWVQGKARGELPWFGLIRLSFGDKINQYNPAWIRMPFTNAYAPADLWTMLFISIGLIVAAPLAYDVFRGYRRRERLLAGEPPDEASARRAEAEAPRTLLLTLLTAGGYAALWAYRAAARRRMFGERVGPPATGSGSTWGRASVRTPEASSATDAREPTGATARHPAHAAARQPEEPAQASAQRAGQTMTRGGARGRADDRSPGAVRSTAADRKEDARRALATMGARLRGEHGASLSPAMAALLFFPGLLLGLPAVYGVYRLTADARRVAGHVSRRTPGRVASVFAAILALAILLFVAGHLVLPGGVALVAGLAAGLAAVAYAVHVVGDTHDDVAVAALRAARGPGALS